jgi:hypothetical protein
LGLSKVFGFLIYFCHWPIKDAHHKKKESHRAFGFSVFGFFNLFLSLANERCTSQKKKLLDFGVPPHNQLI